MINAEKYTVKRKPRILLIGVGLFGERHMETLKLLEKKGRLFIVGAVVATTKSQEKISKKYNIPVWTELTDELLRQVDAVDIVTPPETHFEIAMRCLPFADVLMEKPITMNEAEAIKLSGVARKYKRILMVGHIYRFHPVVRRLKSLLDPFKKEAAFISGRFINPENSDSGRSVVMELPHLSDIVDYIYNLVPTVISAKPFERTVTVDMKYPQNKHAVFKLGWEGGKKIRAISFSFRKKKIECDLIQNIIQIHDLKNNKTDKIHCPSLITPLEEEITTFIDVIKGKKIDYPDAKIGTRLVQIGEKSTNSIKTLLKKTKKPKVAIIGAGIFGTNVAIEIGNDADITIFEKNNDILTEASYVNQYRHHWGYHYPRSSATVKDILNAIKPFEEKYDKAIIRNFPTYYCIAKEGSKITHKEYIDFCDSHNLPYTIEDPDPEYVNLSKV